MAPTDHWISLKDVAKKESIKKKYQGVKMFNALLLLVILFVIAKFQKLIAYQTTDYR